MEDGGNRIRISLPPGEVLRGEKRRYTVENMISFSERSVTVSGRSEDGRAWRLKYYNGDSALTEEVLKKLLAFPVKGVVLPTDCGRHAGILFLVFPVLPVTSADRFPVSLQLLREQIIPRLASVLEQYHEQGILLRDICPEHILYSPDKGRTAYCGLNNAVELTGRASFSKSPGYGQHFGYLAPEVEESGYSRASDYFSLGMTILTLLDGCDHTSGMTRESFRADILEGRVAGIDRGHLASIPYALYSAEDKIFYLILGLLLADPQKRWGCGEVRCWLHDQEIPLVAEKGKKDYQFTRACVIGGRQCWNQKELAWVAASDEKVWRDHTAGIIRDFVETQHLKDIPSFPPDMDDPAISAKGKVFRWIYTLDPALDGLWWEGHRYGNMQELIDAANYEKYGVTILSALLRDRCFSFFEKMRGKTAPSGCCGAVDLETFERWEAEEPRKGANRCIMKFAPDLQSRFFRVGPKTYHTLSQLLEAYREDGETLRKLSPAILSDGRFQAWLWACGMEKAGVCAAELSRMNPEQSFFLLLGICEKAEQEEAVKKTARALYLRWGDYAPVVWLTEHIRYYRPTSSIHQFLYDTFDHATFDLNETLEALSGKAQRLVVDYQTFVNKTAKKEFCDRADRVGKGIYGYEPLYMAYCFSAQWRNGWEVSPAFLKWAGEKI